MDGIYSSIKNGEFSENFSDLRVSDEVKGRCFDGIKFITSLRIKDQSEVIQGFCSQFSDDKFVFVQSHRLSLGEHLTINSFDGLDSLKLTHSFFSLPNVNVLRFSGKEDVYIFQNQTSVDGVWIPARGIFIQFQYITRDLFRKIFFEIVDNFHLISTYFSSPAEFRSLIASSSRPSHTFSNIAPVINYLSDNLSCKIPLRYMDNVTMFRFSEIYDFIEGEEILDHNYILHEHFSSGSFFYKVGSKFSNFQKSQALLFDEKYRNTSFTSACVENFKSRLQNPDKVVWIGITGQKREWIEQIDGAVETIKYFKHRYSRPFFIFDGWTSSIHKGERSTKQMREDSSVIKSILDKLSQQGIKIRSFSTVGLLSKEKVEIAKSVDFFVCNHGSGSLHVSRFAQKHGVTHLSNTFFKSHGDETIHYNATKVPDDLVTDIIDEGNSRPDFINYSIDPKMFRNFLIDCYEEIEPIGFAERLKILARWIGRNLKYSRKRF